MTELSKQSSGSGLPTRQAQWIWLALALIFAALAWGIYYFRFYRKPTGPLDAFAKCLSAKGVRMYGAWWCPHCAEQKEMFGSSFQYVNYVECSPAGQKTQNDVCKQAGLKGYPTWQFADGSRAEGTVHLEALSDKTGCKLR